MSELVEVRVPDLGDYAEVPVIEVLVALGDEVAAEDPLVALESDKATMEIPAPQRGVVRELLVALGDQVSAGTPLLRLEAVAPSTDGGAPAPAAAPAADAVADLHAEVLVLGAGPGGYTAAFRAADLGKRTLLVERHPALGGVCLNVGCIPSKALLHVAKVLAEAEASAAHGVRFAAPEIDLPRVRGWKDEVVGRLTGGLSGLARQRGVEVVRGTAAFTGPHTLEVDGTDGPTTVSFDHCVIAVGSRPARLPGIPQDDPRVMDSTDALALRDVPERLLVIGGGIIGLEMATVYDALGAQVTVVELMDQLIPGCDPDLVRPLQQRIEQRYAGIRVGTRVEAVEARDDGLHVRFAGDAAPERAVFDRVLVAVGRRPNGGLIGADRAGVHVNERGTIPVDSQLRTNVPHIFAIGDVVGEPMLAHKATHEGKVAAEVIAGHDVAFDARSIPSVAYTDPELAWTGLNEIRAKAEGVPYEVASFPWAASGRAITLGRTDGLTKLLVDPDTRRVLGGGIVGAGAGELIAEVAHAIEMAADAADLGLTIHPHPTLSETIGFAAEAVEGTITDMIPPRRRSAPVS